MSAKEVYRDCFPTCNAHISYGLSFPEACSKHVNETFNAKRVYIIASGSLSRNTKHVKDLQKALGDKVVGVRNGMQPHTLWSECLSITKEAREQKADLLITLGAGSLTDAAKIIALALANDASTMSDLDALHNGNDKGDGQPDLKAPTVPIISIPTSLSGGEYNNHGGGTNDATHRKHRFSGPIKGPALVILDPALTLTTPDSIWLSTGIRAVDHCVESMCSLSSTPASNTDAANGLKQLIPGLLCCKTDRGDLEARHKCQMGVIDSIKAVSFHKVPVGASHGIGHQLGPLGVGHGETSCIMLPAVCKFNASVNESQQAKAREALWSDEVVEEMLVRRGLSKDKADLGDMLDAVISELGMPRSLKAVGVGEDKLDMLAANSLHDHACQTNPIPLSEKGQVLEILKMALS